MIKKLGVMSENIGLFILQFFNYNNIENRKGTNHIALNFIDLSLSVIYLIFSLWKLKTVSQVVFWTNFIILFRLLIKNVKKSSMLREKYREICKEKSGALYKSPYDMILYSALSGFFVFFIIFICNGFPFSDGVVCAFAVFVTFFNFGGPFYWRDSRNV